MSNMEPSLDVGQNEVGTIPKVDLAENTLNHSGEESLSQFLVLKMNKEECESDVENQADADELAGKSKIVQHILSPIETNEKKRQREEDEEVHDYLTSVYLRVVYPLNENMDKSLTVGIFKSLNFKPAVLLNQCGKSTILLSMELWELFIQYIIVIESYLYNNVTGKKTSIGLDSSDIEVDSVRLKGIPYVRFRDMTKHNKKVLLTADELQVLAIIAPLVTRYLQQLVTYEPLVSHYLKKTLIEQPLCKLRYGPIDPSFYNRLTHEVEAFRRIEFIVTPSPSGENDKLAQTP